MVIKHRRQYATEEMMLQIAKSLVSDLEDCMGSPGKFYMLSRALRSGSVPRIRESAPTQAANEQDPYVYKCVYQLQNLLKRYRFQKDTYTETELIDKACKTFIDTQDRLREARIAPRNWFFEAVLDSAAEYIAKVLGKYDADEHRSVCRFGTGASVGVPSRLACEAARWELPISGSASQVEWFTNNVVQVDPRIPFYWAQRSIESGSIPDRWYDSTDFLTLSLVPKTFKSLRSIMPNTTIGSFITDGVQRMIARRLKRVGFDIKVLQMQHRDRARLASIHQQDVTLDLSSASDSLSRTLMQRLLPPDWFHIMDSTRIGNVKLPNGTIIEGMETFCTMGVGYTFPLQTLIFLSLLKATEKWTDSTRPRNWAHITVYGDDMIFDRGIYHNVTLLFKYLGLVINVDKSFVDGGFRESCGGDYFHGVDVRPFQPESADAVVSQRGYEAVLYKMINGLRRRWSEHEIPKTLEYLASQLGTLGTKVFLVPPDYPDEAGIQSQTQEVPSFLEGLPIAETRSLGHGVTRFSYLRLDAEERKEERHDPYYWASLGGRLDTCNFTGTQHLSKEFTDRQFRIRRFVDRRTGVANVGVSLLVEHYQKTWISVGPKFIGPPQQKRKDLSTYVTVRHTGTYTRQKGISCTWDPK